MLHVVQQDVTVDVGYHHIERALVGQDGCVALEYADTINVVQLDVFERIAHTPFVNVDGRTGSGATHPCQNGKYRRAASHVEQRFALKVGFQQFAYDEAGGFVVSCSEGHLRIDDNVVFCLRYIVVEGAVDDATVTDDDGLEEVLFPFFVPVLVFCFLISIGRGSVGQRKTVQCRLQGFFVVQGGLYVGSYAALLFYKTFEADFAQYGGEDIVDYLRAWFCMEDKF